jgi:hypothetical protein
MRSPGYLSVCSSPSLCLPPSTNFCKEVVGSSSCVSVCSSPIISDTYEAYDMALLSVCLCALLSLLGNGQSECLGVQALFFHFVCDP